MSRTARERANRDGVVSGCAQPQRVPVVEQADQHGGVREEEQCDHLGHAEREEDLRALARPHRHGDRDEGDEQVRRHHGERVPHAAQEPHGGGGEPLSLGHERGEPPQAHECDHSRQACADRDEEQGQSQVRERRELGRQVEADDVEQQIRENCADRQDHQQAAQRDGVDLHADHRTVLVDKRQVVCAGQQVERWLSCTRGEERAAERTLVARATRSQLRDRTPSAAAMPSTLRGAYAERHSPPCAACRAQASSG